LEKIRRMQEWLGVGGEEPEFVLISEIQGEGASLVIGQKVTIEAVVVGSFQEEKKDDDNNSLTSEGIYICICTFCNKCKCR